MQRNLVPNKWQLGILVIIAFGAFYLAAILGEPPTKWSDILRLVSASITATTVSVAAFHLGVWRWLPHFLAPKPIVDGTWEVTGTPWSKDDKPTLPFKGYLFVKQHYFTLSMSLVTEQTSSELVVEQFSMTKGGLHELWAIYYCEPRPTVDPNLVRPHYGAVRLTLTSSDGRIQLSGRYWIDGEYIDQHGQHVNGGKLLFSNRKSKNYCDYAAAEQAYK